MKGREPKCLSCKPVPYAITMDENLDFIHLYHKYSFMFGNGMGGLNTDAFRFIFELEEDLNKEVFMTKFNIFYSNGLKVSK